MRISNSSLASAQEFLATRYVKSGNFYLTARAASAFFTRVTLRNSRKSLKGPERAASHDLARLLLYLDHTGQHIWVPKIMTRQIAIALAGVLVIALPAGATPIESYGFDTPAVTDTGDTLRRLLVPGQRESGAPTSAMLGQSATPSLGAASAKSGMRRGGVLITEAMTPPALTAALPPSDDTVAPAGPPVNDDRVAISEPHMALLMLAGLAGLLRRRRRA